MRGLSKSTMDLIEYADRLMAAELKWIDGACKGCVEVRITTDPRIRIVAGVDERRNSFPTSTADLSANERQFIAALQQLEFGRVESVRILKGELVLLPRPRFVRTVKFGAASPHAAEDPPTEFGLKRQIVELITCAKRGCRPDSSSRGSGRFAFLYGDREFRSIIVEGRFDWRAQSAPFESPDLGRSVQHDPGAANVTSSVLEY